MDIEVWDPHSDDLTGDDFVKNRIDQHIQI